VRSMTIKDTFGGKDGNDRYPFCPSLKRTEFRDMPVARPCDLVLDEGVVEDVLARANGSIGVENGSVEDKDEEQGRPDLP